MVRLVDGEVFGARSASATLRRFSIRHLLRFVLSVAVGMGIYPIVIVWSGPAEVVSVTVLQVFGAVVGLACFAMAWIVLLRDLR